MNSDFIYKKNILPAFLLFFCSNLFAMKNYYFSKAAGEAGDGCMAHPYNSLDKLKQIKFEPGDTVYLNGKDLFSGSIVLNNLHGSKEQPIIFTSWQNGKAVINAAKREALVFNNSSNFKITNLIFSGAGRKTGNTANGVKLTSCNDAVLEKLDISGFQKSGLLMYNSVNIKAESIHAHDNGYCGILVEGEYKKKISGNIHIVNCRADNNPGDPTNLTNHSGNGILVGNCKNILVEYCTATNNGWDMPRKGNGPVGIWAYEADSVIIQYCIAYRNKTAKGASDGGGFDFDGGVTNSVMQYCLSYQNQGSGYGIYQYKGASDWYNNTIRYCVSINDGTDTYRASAMLIWNGNNPDSGFHHFYAYNNFFYNDRKYAFGFDPQNAHQHFYFLNNVFVAADTADMFVDLNSSKSDIFMGNVWMRKNGGFLQERFTDIAKWSAARGYEQDNGRLTGTVIQKKLFDIPSTFEITDPYLLTTDTLLRSLCNDSLRNKGIDVKSKLGIETISQGFFGNEATGKNGFSVGICEY